MRAALLFVLFAGACMAQRDSACRIDAGLCVKKMFGFYWLNGVYGEIRPLNAKPLVAGINITSSSLGSALGSNAIAVHIAELYGQYRFRAKHMVQIPVGMNVGVARASLGDKYPMLPRSQMLISPEAGLSCVLRRVTISATMGYNMLTGNGIHRLGLIYPLYFNFKAAYRFGPKT